jgi:hypothetical protein
MALLRSTIVIASESNKIVSIIYQLGVPKSCITILLKERVTMEASRGNH